MARDSSASDVLGWQDPTTDFFLGLIRWCGYVFYIRFDSLLDVMRDLAANIDTAVTNFEFAALE